MLKVCRIAVLLVGAVLLQGPLTAPLVAGERQAPMSDALHGLAGFWKAAEYKVGVSSDLDVQVWGKGASKVRSVELAIEGTGEGVLRVRTAVVDARGRTRPYSASVVEARLAIEAPTAAGAAGPIEPRVKVLSAEERYLDSSGEKRPIEGLTVTLHAMTPDSREINMRYDTAQGFGSFGETLIRRGKSASVEAGRTASR